MKNDYQIRPATVEDVEPIRRMHAKSWCDTYRNDQLGVTADWLKKRTDAWLTPDKLEESKKRLKPFFDSDDENFYRVALSDGQIVGLLHCDRIKNGNKHLAAIYLDKAHQGTGLANQLMTLADAWFGDDVVELEVVKYNQRAKAFYRKWGFEEVPGSDSLYAEILPTINMVREPKNKRRVKNASTNH